MQVQDAARAPLDSPVSRALIATLDAELTASGDGFRDVFAPFTGQLLHRIPVSSPAAIASAAEAARFAQLDWAKSGPAHRRRVLLAAHDLLLERREELLDILQTETGKTRGQAFEELFQGATVTRYYALSAAGTLRTRRRRAGIPAVLSTRVAYSPKGLVGIITPWNYPLALALMDVVPALAAGNAVLHKADNQGALTVLAARRAFLDAGVPAALWPVVAGDGPEVGGALIDTVDAVCFTGSTATGRTVAKQAAVRLVAASLELGGKNPLLILDDVDPDRAAADAAYACFASLGQLCTSIERIYVQRATADEFTDAFVRRVSSLAQGPAFDYTSDIGSLTTAAQLERVAAHVADAVAKGATVLIGGRRRADLGPFFYEPTVLTGVTEDMLCARQETFGPVVAITVVDGVEEAILGANDTSYGLNAAIFSSSRRRARRVALALQAGSVNINEGYRASFASVDAPMGGRKDSGLGRRNGPEGLLRFVESQTISESTGILQLPRTGSEFARLSGIMLLLLTTLRLLHRR